MGTACLLSVVSCGTGLKEASSNFDSNEVDGFLQKVSTLVESGFGEPERNQVIQMLKSLKIDEQKSLEFKVTFKQTASPLRVTLYLDDVDAVDMYFFAEPALADAIQAEMNKR